MDIKYIHINNTRVAEIISNEIVIHNAQDALDLLMNCSYQDAEKIILYENQITPDFFDLKTKIAGDVLQKFSQYRVQLAIVGDFDKYASKSLKDLIYESNKTGHIRFVSSLQEALTSHR